MSKKQKKVLVGASGSIATVKLPELINALFKTTVNLEIRVVLTSQGRFFYEKSCLYNEKNWKEYEERVVKVYSDDGLEWKTWNKIGILLHI